MQQAATAHDHVKYRVGFHRVPDIGPARAAWG